MRARYILCGLLMVASVALIGAAFVLTSHGAASTPVLSRDTIVFYSALAAGFATLVVSGFGAWLWDGIPGNKLGRLMRVFAILVAAILLLGLGPVAAASALHKDYEWVDGFRACPLLALLVWDLIARFRRNKPVAIQPR